MSVGVHDKVRTISCGALLGDGTWGPHKAIMVIEVPMITQVLINQNKYVVDPTVRSILMSA